MLPAEKWVFALTDYSGVQDGSVQQFRVQCIPNCWTEPSCTKEYSWTGTAPLLGVR